MPFYKANSEYQNRPRTRVHSGEKKKKKLKDPGNRYSRSSAPVFCTSQLEMHFSKSGIKYENLIKITASYKIIAKEKSTRYSRPSLLTALKTACDAVCISSLVTRQKARLWGVRSHLHPQCLVAVFCKIKLCKDAFNQKDSSLFTQLFSPNRAWQE